MTDQHGGDQANLQTDEVELIDYINVLCRHKKMIILGTIACMAAAGIISFLLPPVHRISTIVEIGSVEEGEGKRVLLEEPIALVEKIKGEVYDETIRKKLNIAEGDYPEIHVKNPKGTALVNVSIDTSDKEDALKILETLNELMLNEHLELISIQKVDIEKQVQEKQNEIVLVNRTRESLNKNIQLIKKNREQLKQQIEEVSARISELERGKSKVDRKANTDNALSLLLFTNEIQENRKYYNELQDRLSIELEKEEGDLNDEIHLQDKNLKSLTIEKEKLEAQLIAFRDTRIVKKEGYNEKPVKPNKKLNVLISGFISLIILFFAAFFIEYIQASKKKDLEGGPVQ